MDETAAHRRHPVAGPGGAPWRDLPPGYPPWPTVYGLFRRWQLDGTRARVLSGLQARADAAGLITWDVSVDSTVVRAHQHAAGARKKGHLQAEPPAGEPADHAIGRSRGGLATKVHLALRAGPEAPVHPGHRRAAR